MATNRNMRESDVKADMLKNIEDAFNEIHYVLAQAFSKNSSHLLDIFNAFWAELSQLENVENVAQFDHYYRQVKQNFDLTTVNISTHVLTPHIKNIFLDIIELHQAIARQRYFVVNIANEKLIPTQMISLETQCAEVNKQLDDLEQKQKQFGPALESFESFLNLLVEEFSNAGYGRIGTATKKPDRHHSNFNAATDTVKHLPTISNIRLTIDNLYKAAISHSNTDEVKKYQSTLREQMVQLESIRSMLATTLCERILFNEKNYEELLRQQDNLNKKLKAIENLTVFLHNKKATELDLTAISRNINENGQELINDCNGNTHWYSMNKVWEHVASRLKVCIDKLSSDVDNFNAPYKSNASNVAALSKVAEHCLERSKQNHQFLLKLAATVSNAKTIAEQIEKKINYVKNTIFEHVESGIEFLTLFMKRHGAKMLIGGLTGVSISVVVSLAVALSPPAIIVLAVAGAAWGSGLGGGAGWTLDRIKDKNKNKTEELVESNTNQAVPVVAQPAAFKSKKSPIERFFDRMPASLPTVETLDTVAEQTDVEQSRRPG